MNELVGGLGYAVKNWWMSLLLGLLYIAVALCLLFAPCEQLCGTECHFQYFNSWSWYPRNLLLPSATKRLSTVGDGIWQVMLIC